MAWIKPAEAIEKFGNKLSYYEINKEINEYTAIYYAGQKAVDKLHEFNANNPNFGYDNPDGTYKVVKNDHIAYRFEIIKVLGQGVSGQVLEVYDHRSKRAVALKVFTNSVDFTDNALQEVQMLQTLQQADKKDQFHLIQMYENFVFRDHQCIVFEILAMNLYELIQKNNYQGFSIRLIRKFAKSMLETLAFLKKNEVIHCDLKPENIMLKEKGKAGIKISDFSSACHDQFQMYLYIQSRSYRAPEVIFGAKYSFPIDMWSFGCILAELHSGDTLFSGCDEDDQVGTMIEVLGMPPDGVLKRAEKKYNFVSSKGYPRYCTITAPDGEVAWTDGRNAEGVVRGKPGTRKLSDAVKSKDRVFLDFLSKCLEWDPSKRLTPKEALKHEFIVQLNADAAAHQRKKPSAVSTSKSTSNARREQKVVKTKSFNK